jgi:preprotein translocase subunit SecG
MYQFILIIHVLAAVALIALVLVQQGKGATVGAAFGSGASQTVFGSRGSGSFLMRVTIGFLIVFFTTSIALNNLASRIVKQQQVISLPQTPAETNAPVSPSSIPLNLPTSGETGKDKSN